MKSIFKIPHRCKLAGYVLILSLLFLQCQSRTSIPEPRELDKKERTELANLIEARFRVKVPESTQYRAAGNFRFAETDDFIYIDRTDVGSVAFERTKYGLSQIKLDPDAIKREKLLPKIEAALSQTGLQVDGRQFESFLDEFVGTTQPSGLSIPVDPRENSIHVARTAEFSRRRMELPVFRSELIIGLMPDGTIGRFRLHWPVVNESIVKETAKLQKAVRERTWNLPEIVKQKDTEILELTAGIGHPGFADFGNKVEPVVKVLYRRISKDPEYPLSSTGYKFFDKTGREMTFTSFPEIKASTKQKIQ